MNDQLSLFAQPSPSRVGDVLQEDCLGINGLTYRANVIEPEAQARILAEIDRLPWRSDLKRRVQHYGYVYDYRARTLDESMRTDPFPRFAVEVARRLYDLRLVTEMPDQLIVNEYQPGQGIAAHVDCEPCFKDRIVTVSLGSTYEMDLIHPETQEVRSTLLEVGSALVLTRDARHIWLHRIRSRLSDRGIPRGRRVSLTYRNVVLASSPD